MQVPEPRQEAAPLLQYISSAGVVILVLAFVCGIGALVLKLMFKERKERKERCAALAAMGFSDCPDRMDYLEGMFKFLCGIEETGARPYDVSMPMLREQRGETVYHLWIRRTSGGDSGSSWEETFLFPFKRRTEQPVTLMMSAQKVPQKLMGFLGGLLARAMGGGMAMLDLPRELQGGNIIAAFGPAGASLYDLLDSATISEITRGVDAGAAAFRAHQDWASVSVDPRKGGADLPPLWQHVERLAALR